MSRLLVAQRALTVPGWAKDDLSRKARAIPSLDLRFAENKSLVDATTGSNLVTFTRASSGTYVDSAGVLQTATNDVARFDHNPTTGESLGLLVEEQRTNLLLRSEEFGTTWDASNLTVSADTTETTAPNGTVTADKITGSSAASNIKRISQSVTLSAIPYAFSVYAKASNQNFLQIRTFTDFGNIYANFDIATGVVGTTLGVTSASVVAVGSGWYRCQVVFTPAAATSSLSLNFITALTSSSPQNTTLTTSLYLWGAQLEAGAFPTSYIPTTTATVTRSADVASITGANFSSWYNQTEGTVFAEFTPRTFAQACGLLSLDDGTTSERLQTRLNTSGNGTFVVADGGSVQANFGTTASASLNTKAKFATSFAVNLFKESLNGGSVASDTSGTLPTVTQAVIGNAVGAFIFNGPLSRITFWPKELSESTLQQITQ